MRPFPSATPVGLGAAELMAIARPALGCLLFSAFPGLPCACCLVCAALSPVRFLRCLYFLLPLSCLFLRHSWALAAELMVIVGLHGAALSSVLFL